MAVPHIALAFRGKSPYTVGLDPRDVTIGSDPRNPVVLPHGDVAVLHARMFVGAERVFLQGLDPQCPTLVNGEPISGIVEVGPGDVVGIGPFRFAAHLGEPQADAPEDEEDDTTDVTVLTSTGWRSLRS